MRARRGLRPRLSQSRPASASLGQPACASALRQLICQARWQPACALALRLGQPACAPARRQLVRPATGPRFAHERSPRLTRHSSASGAPSTASSPGSQKRAVEAC
eukprot:scaffold29778_cov62-Phaeocystis_antarctica.AAC.3